MEYAPIGPETGNAEKKTPPTDPPERDRGVLDKWLRRDNKKSQQTPEISAPKQETTQAIEHKKTRTQRFAQGILRLFGRGETSIASRQTAEIDSTQRQPLPAETAPLIEQAGRIRRFANIVINRVLGVAEQEHVHPKQPDARPERSVDTEPLIEAAGDLREAVQELERAMPESAPTTSTAIEKTQPVYDSSPDGGVANWAMPETAPRISQLVTERVSQRIQQLENRLEEESGKNSLTAAAVAAGIGVVAVAGVLMLGHEYLTHRKIKRDQQGIKKEQRKQLDAQVAQEAAFDRLQQEQTAQMARHERQQYYRRLSEFTHHQADITRGAAHELRQSTHAERDKPEPRQPKDMPIPVPQIDRAEPSHRTSERIAEPAANLDIERPVPIVAVESADTVEHGPSPVLSPQAGSQGGGSGGGVVSSHDAKSADNQPKDSKAPLAPSAQHQQALQKARAARLASNAWLYGGLLVIAGIAAVIWMLVF